MASAYLVSLWRSWAGSGSTRDASDSPSKMDLLTGKRRQKSPERRVTACARTSRSGADEPPSSEKRGLPALRRWTEERGRGRGLGGGGPNSGPLPQKYPLSQNRQTLC